MSMSIARFGFYLCFLGLVAAHFEREGLTCKANGEYCQMHSDCCSRKCMTYLNVCARRIDEGFSPEIPHQSNSIYDIDVKQSAKEFPDIVDIVTLATESKQTPQAEQGRQCQPVGGQCSVGEECCTKRCLFYAHKCVT